MINTHIKITVPGPKKQEFETLLKASGYQVELMVKDGTSQNSPYKVEQDLELALAEKLETIATSINGVTCQLTQL